MFVVTYHNKNAGSFFIGVADTKDQAEAIIRKDMRNCNTSSECYNISEVACNYPQPFCIERVVDQEPYRV